MDALDEDDRPPPRHGKPGWAQRIILTLTLIAAASAVVWTVALAR